MRIPISKYAALAVATGICLASVVFGQSTNSNGFVEFSPPPGPALDGIYTSPYYATINGGPVVPVICDDWADNVTAGNFWTANITDLSAFKGNNDVQSVYYESAAPIAPTPDVQTTDYIAAAILATEISGFKTAALTPAAGGADNPDLSFALWALFNPAPIPYLAACANTLSPLNTVPCTMGPTGDAAKAQAYLTAALAEAGTFANGTAYLTAESALLGTKLDVTIYSQSAGNAVCSSNCIAQGEPTRFQEMVKVTVPEPATWAVLGFDFVGAGIVGLYFRRRNSRIRS